MHQNGAGVLFIQEIRIFLRTPLSAAAGLKHSGAELVLVSNISSCFCRGTVYMVRDDRCKSSTYPRLGMTSNSALRAYC
jgi:hypothetical protein